MKTSQYYKSESHTISIKNARLIAQNNTYCCLSCKNTYSTKNFIRHTCKPCPTCSTIIVTKEKKFCSKSCAATFNNKKRTLAMRNKQSNVLKQNFKDNPQLVIKLQLACKATKNFCRITFVACKQCSNSFIVKNWKLTQNQYCSDDCRTKSRMAKKTHYHGNKKIFKYLNTFTNEIVNLESSWEFKIAQFLDNLTIIWTRPDPISWLDQNLKSHLYYADFYLPEHNLYLDPKNPYVMQQDEYKMSVIEKKVSVIYGSVNYLKQSIQELLNNNNQI